MTKRERQGKAQISRKLAQEGYVTYAELFDLFDLYLTKDPEVVGYMIPNEAVIVINEYLDIDQISMVIRHEILHEFLDHQKRYETIGLKGIKGSHNVFNMAADYEISNLGYTDRDKKNARALKLGDTVISGLVTDVDHPDWINKNFEEMHDLLLKESPSSLKPPKIGARGNKEIQKGEQAQREAQELSEQAEEEAEGEESGDDGEGSSGKADNKGGQSSGSGDESEPGDPSSGEDGEGDSSSGSDSESSGSPGGKKANKYDDEDYQKMSPDEKKKERVRRRKEAAKKIKEEADKIIDQLKDALDTDPSKSKKKDDNPTKGGPGGSSVDKNPLDTSKERAERIAKIEKILRDFDKVKEAKSEINRAIREEQIEKGNKDLSKYRENSLTRFTESLNKFIKDAIARARNQSWSHINKKYVNSGLLKPGYTNAARGHVPSINVYFDRSGSWNSSKTEKGNQAISTLNKYVTRGELKINLFYFNSRVLSTDPGGNGGTDGEPILQHILMTKPNNVIILTDDDISDCRTKVEVEGAVWFLWYGTDHNQIGDYLSGKKLTREFRVE